jgi:hypothetical protein
MCIGSSCSYRSFSDDTFHGSYWAVWQDYCQTFNKALKKTNHDLKLAQGNIVVVKAGQKEDMFAGNQIDWGKASNFNIIRAVWKFAPFRFVKGKAIWMSFGDSLSQRFTKFRSYNLVSHRFTFARLLIEHYSLGPVVAILRVFIATRVVSRGRVIGCRDKCIGFGSHHKKKQPECAQRASRALYQIHVGKLLDLNRSQVSA